MFESNGVKLSALAAMVVVLMMLSFKSGPSSHTRSAAHQKGLDFLERTNPKPKPQPQAATLLSSDTDLVSPQRTIEALVAENKRLSAQCGGGGGGGGGGGDEEALRARVAAQEREISGLRDSLAQAKAMLAKAKTALQESQTAVVPADDGRRSTRSRQQRSTGGSTLDVSTLVKGAAAQVPSCATQKLEFLRWTKDANGNKLTCQFSPENYENWTKMPPLCDYISIECLGPQNYRAAHVFGFGGPNLMIGIADKMMWEFVFARHKSIRRFVELGTMSGGTTLYWGITARTRKGTLHTFDRSDYRDPYIKNAWLDNMFFHKTDILTNRKPGVNPNEEVVNVLDVGEPVLALFDNGDKKRETDLYCRYLPVGSVLLLHDWEHLNLPKPHWEMSYSMVQTELEARGFEKAYFDFAEHIGASTRVFLRTRMSA